ncbi:lipoprotein signal peptidase [uncultured Fibrella sp.]|uniref:lipoprotein signal peptidase n=1 Tax=uncultured Fibrella sp. TaxID=1284596 RepID=UPI0035C9F11A
MEKRKRLLRVLLTCCLLTGLDQATKLGVHLTMAPGPLGELPLIGTWLKLHYVLNPGMAFGMQIGHEYGKLVLVGFRLLALWFICTWLVRLSQQPAPTTAVGAVTFIFSGALGNVIDSTFYGVLLHNAPPDSPMAWFHGQVIDMIFADVWEGFLPRWLPVWGGQFISMPIFNLADSFIFMGIWWLLLFERRFLNQLLTPSPAERYSL